MSAELSVIEESIERRSAALFREHQIEDYKFTDHLFVGLMIFQWIAGIVVAEWVSPKVWYGQFSKVHLHVWAALILGGLITFYPVLLALTQSGKTTTRYVIAIGQMLMSALLIHLTGGRIETHFHVFGSLAFLAFYKDWRVLVPATVVVALDHWLRGVYWPQSVYGVLSVSPWRWVEHAGWVVFEDIILVMSCLQSVKQMKNVASQRARLEATNQIVEKKITERTSELTKSNELLKKEIEDRKRLEGVVLQSEKMAAVGQLAGGVAHEINNPLGVILGFAQGVAKRLQPGDAFELPLKSIEREALRCKVLVQDLLTFSRVGTTEKEETNLNETIESSLSLILAQAKVKNVELIKDLSSNLSVILANKNQIQQVLVNLSNNAMDAMPNGGKLTVRTKKTQLNNKDTIEIQVEDTGQGIPKEIQAKIFEPFFTTKEVGKGTGLGLSLVYEIIQKHEGQIKVESEVGKGTKFSFLLPVESQS